MCPELSWAHLGFWLDGWLVYDFCLICAGDQVGFSPFKSSLANKHSCQQRLAPHGSSASLCGPLLIPFDVQVALPLSSPMTNDDVPCRCVAQGLLHSITKLAVSVNSKRVTTNFWLRRDKTRPNQIKCKSSHQIWRRNSGRGLMANLVAAACFSISLASIRFEPL